MKVVCITGSIATGKSTVLKMLASKSHKVYDSDVIARQIFQKNEKKIIDELGSEILEDGVICKQKVRNLIFKNKIARKKLENIIHPKIYQYLFLQIIKCFFLNYSVIFVEVPLFFELGLEKYFDCIVVFVDEEIQKERLVARDGRNVSEEALKIQLPISIKKEMGRWALNNNKSIENTQSELESIQFNGNCMVSYLLFFFFIFLMLKCLD